MNLNIWKLFLFSVKGMPTTPQHTDSRRCTNPILGNTINGKKHSAFFPNNLEPVLDSWTSHVWWGVGWVGRFLGVITSHPTPTPPPTHLPNPWIPMDYLEWSTDIMKGGGGEGRGSKVLTDVMPSSFQQRFQWSAAEFNEHSANRFLRSEIFAQLSVWLAWCSWAYSVRGDAS